MQDAPADTPDRAADTLLHSSRSQADPPPSLQIEAAPTLRCSPVRSLRFVVRAQADWRERSAPRSSTPHPPRSTPPHPDFVPPALRTTPAEFFPEQSLSYRSNLRGSATAPQHSEDRSRQAAALHLLPV